MQDSERGASMEVVLALVAPDRREWIFGGRVKGKIALDPKGESKKSLPYDKIFVPKGYTRTFAEMTSEEKNALSHRGKAFKKLKGFLDKKLWQE